MLDYTILNSNEANFTKNISVSNIKNVLNEVIEIMNDKVQMKAINI